MIFPTWNPELASPKDVADAIATMYIDAEGLTAAESADVARHHSAAVA
jgi:hypothetical protein